MSRSGVRPLERSRASTGSSRPGYAGSGCRVPGRRRTFRPASPTRARGRRRATLCHKLGRAIPFVDHRRHVPVLYAHNDILRSYSRRESGRLLANVGVIVCVSDSIAAQTADRLPPSLHPRIRVVRNGVDAVSVPSGAEPGAAPPLQVAFVGRMQPEKGAAVLVDALRRLDRDDLRLRIIGSQGFDPGRDALGLRAGAPSARRSRSAIASSSGRSSPGTRSRGCSDRRTSSWSRRRGGTRCRHGAGGHGGRSGARRLRHRRHPRSRRRTRGILVPPGDPAALAAALARAGRRSRTPVAGRAAACRRAGGGPGLVDTSHASWTRHWAPPTERRSGCGPRPRQPALDVMSAHASLDWAADHDGVVRRTPPSQRSSLWHSSKL